ncbi:MarR family winged helix-turn-helix transcriptional regulator [Clostridium cochlearium]|uniref:MarR family transcriptional regulator n=1 Tax=Clostridium cochlearium TaxID=1494 RepID=A0A240B479_CLOCO|nr:MarR family transcriptional regulator [Clostridium cochlearium]MBV1816634.1 winged helix DNA-binding protein [Bacteroidales bacterium MSK.15.36]NSJ91098.1 winged helix DNA-binding protein [Coprococcus sp. MSK.21.13]MBE6065617.1 MarR family transcriptional regulator [Clostridium cochlearium]MBU5270230.1 winged helix DNA-binding protein [Clostridium cochlearium]MCG4571319.1 MarR family transcriptional regulator [Clostridium cochlearium]
MSKSMNVLNELLVDLFNDILTIEQNAIQSGEFKDLSVTEMHTIEAIGMYTQKTMSEVANELNITVGTLTIAINNLVKKGYVQRSKSEKDRRIVQISLTKRGKLAYRIHSKFHSDMIKETISGLTDEEEEVLITSLEKLNKFFKEKYHLKKD